MSDNDQPMETPHLGSSSETRQMLASVGDFIERAREHHARTGEWPPDPTLDEVNETRRRVEAEHGNDPRKVLEWYVQAGKRHLPQSGGDSGAALSTSAGAGGR
jgi:hypothetical protein